MKFTISLTDDESQAFKNWAAQVKPPNLDEENFLKQIFFNGIASINQQISQLAKESLKDPAMREQLKAAGVDVDKLEQEMLAPQSEEPLENPVTEITDPAAPVEVLPDGEVSPKEINTTQDATDTK